jgi:hypothetical protein
MFSVQTLSLKLIPLHYSLANDFIEIAFKNSPLVPPPGKLHRISATEITYVLCEGNISVQGPCIRTEVFVTQHWRIYRVFQKELYNLGSLYKCIQRTCT